MAASKPHVIAFGKWTVIKSSSELDQDRPEDLKIRPLYVDMRLKEFTFGSPHEVTEEVFVVRRIVRVNDTLPQETITRWSWQRSGWIIVDRVTGHISQASLPEFDSDTSSATWYRDYVAYCGISDDGRKISAVVMQLGRRKPILKKPLGDVANDEKASAECAPPAWQRLPTRVSFVSQADQKFTFAVRGHNVEVVTDDDPEEGTR
ncbi:MAG: hypothetical protein WB711_00955 [Terriglobales bacterium]